MAQDTSRPSVSGVAKRVSSTTLSIPSSPASNASAVRGSDSSAWPAAIHRRAFQSLMP